MEEESKLEVTSDLMFQRIFGKVGNERITKGFLEKILGIEIDSLTLDVNKRMQGKWLDDKTGRLDVKAKLSDGTIVIIEMQVAEYAYMAERMLYYWSMAYTEGITRGERYDKLNKTIGILISAENLKATEGIEDYHTVWEIREKEHTDKILTDHLEIHVIELNKFKEGKEKRPENDWIKFIKAKGVSDMEELSDADKALQEAMEEFERLANDPSLREEYLWREKELRDKISFIYSAKQEGIKKGKEEGKEEGEKAKQREIVLNMNKKKFGVETICEITGLSKEEVEEIVKETKKDNL